MLSEYQKGELPFKKEEIKIKEEDFYEKFADYLVKELEECTKAISLGGNRFQDKWGTPDVLGVYKFSEAEPIRPPLEIVSAIHQPAATYGFPARFFLCIEQESVLF